MKTSTAAAPEQNAWQDCYALMAAELGTKPDPLTLALLGIRDGKGE